MLSTDDILNQIKSIDKSIELDYKTIELYKQAGGTDLRSPFSLTFLQLIATVQGNIATKQLQITMLQLGLRNI